jgi:hypothetical protein
MIEDTKNVERINERRILRGIHFQTSTLSLSVFFLRQKIEMKPKDTKADMTS